MSEVFGELRQSRLPHFHVVEHERKRRRVPLALDTKTWGVGTDGGIVRVVARRGGGERTVQPFKYHPSSDLRSRVYHQPRRQHCIIRVRNGLVTAGELRNARVAEIIFATPAGRKIKAEKRSVNPTSLEVISTS